MNEILEQALMDALDTLTLTDNEDGTIDLELTFPNEQTEEAKDAIKAFITQCLKRQTC